MRREHTGNRVEVPAGSSSSCFPSSAFSSSFSVSAAVAIPGGLPLPLLLRRFLIVLAAASSSSVFSTRLLIRHRRRLGGEGPDAQGRTLLELGDEVALVAFAALLPSPPLRLGLLKPPRGLCNLPGGQIDTQNIRQPGVKPLPDISSASTGQVEQGGTVPPRKGVDELALDAVMVLFQREGCSLGAGAQGLGSDWF